jgi:hypothetical protein
VEEGRRGREERRGREGSVIESRVLRGSHRVHESV